jgi:hypothetical protein
VVRAASHAVRLPAGDKENLVDVLFLGLHLLNPDPERALDAGLVQEAWRLRRVVR